jgi:hypothetical protein
VYLFLSILLLATRPSAQVAANKPNQGGLDAAGLTVLDENDFFRVTRVVLAAGKATPTLDRSQDLVIISLSGKSLAIEYAERHSSNALAQGEVRFLTRGSGVIISNRGEDPAEFITAALKHHFDAEVRPCAEPRKCSHPIQVGPAQIGESTLLFSNGFVTAYSHRLDRGGTLASSYYSSNGKDHLLLIALSDLQATFDGEEESFTPGQVYSSDAGQVEASAARGEAHWVVIRMQIPKHMESKNSGY